MSALAGSRLEGQKFLAIRRLTFNLLSNVYGRPRFQSIFECPSVASLVTVAETFDRARFNRAVLKTSG